MPLPIPRMNADRLKQLIQENADDLNEALRQKHRPWADSYGRRRESLRKIAARLGVDFEAAEEGA